jgi:hypothetical protein
MKRKVQTRILVVPPPLSLLVFDNGGGVPLFGTEGVGLALHKHLASAKTPPRESIGKESMQRQVESADGAIDKLVYELSPEGDNNMG